MTTAPENLRARLADATLYLVRIPSVTGNETAIANYIEAWASASAGYAPDAIHRIGDNLVLGTADERPTIALFGHLDTVPPHETDPEPSRDEDRVYGRGASDMKSGMAIMQLLAETLDRAALPFNLILVFYAAEEGPYVESGLGPVLEQSEVLRRVDLAVCLEPTNNSLQVGCLGVINARLILRGRAAHSARPWEGENAVHKAAPILARLAERGIRTVEVGGLPFRESMNVTVADGGRTRNVLPDRFEMNLNVRFAAEGDVQEAVEKAKALVREVAREAEIDLADVAPPGPVPSENRLLDHLIELGALERQPKEAWTDVGRLAAYGIDAVNYGPGATAQAHQAGEWAAIDPMVAAYDVLARFLSTPPS